MANHINANALESIVQELQYRKRDLLELKYLYAIRHCPQILRPTSFVPFSAYDDLTNYGGFSPSKTFLNQIFKDYMANIHLVLDQCLAAVDIRKVAWDHSFKASWPFVSTPGLQIYNLASRSTSC
jgi:hypothetical protein